MKNPILIFALALLIPATAFAQTTAFTYQGKLADGASAANGTYDFEFRLFPNAGDPFPVPLETRTRTNVAVTGGIFTVQLDFSDYQFDITGRYLEIAVKPAGSAAAYTTLAPRQMLTAAPIAIHSIKSDTATNALLLDGVSANSYLRTNGNGINLTNVAKLNVNGAIIAPRIENLAADPEPASASNTGRVYFNTATNSLMLSNGTVWTSTSASRQIQTFTGELASGNFGCTQTTTVVRTATFTKSAAASRLRITVRDVASATGPGKFYLFQNFRIDGAFISNPTNFTMRFISEYDYLFSGRASTVRNTFTAVGYANAIAAGTHTFTTTYSFQGIDGGDPASFTCYRDPDAYLIEIEEIP